MRGALDWKGKSPVEPMLTWLLHLPRAATTPVCRRRLFKEIDLKPSWLVFSDAPYFLEVVEDLGDQCHVITDVWNPPDWISVSSKILACYFICFLPRFSLFPVTALPTCSPAPLLTYRQSSTRNHIRKAIFLFHCCRMPINLSLDILNNFPAFNWCQLAQ